jgi:hypothetical protein
VKVKGSLDSDSDLSGVCSSVNGGKKSDSGEWDSDKVAKGLAEKGRALVGTGERYHL